MMDEDLRRYLDAMTAKINGDLDARMAKINGDLDARMAKINGDLDARMAKINGTLDAMMAKMNDGHEAILNRLTSIERDFENTKGFLVSDALISSRRWLDLDARVTKLERGGS